MTVTQARADARDSYCHESGPLLPGISCREADDKFDGKGGRRCVHTMQILLPFSKVWFSWVFFRPCGVFSLRKILRQLTAFLAPIYH